MGVPIRGRTWYTSGCIQLPPHDFLIRDHTWLRLFSDAKDPMVFIPKDRRGAGKPLTLTSLSYCQETVDKVGSTSSENVEIELYQSCKWDKLTCKAK